MTPREADVFRNHGMALAESIDGYFEAIPALVVWARRLAATFRAGHGVVVAGNGGSAAHSDHLVSELIGQFSVGRAPLRAASLLGTSPVLSALANDFGYAQGAERLVRATCQKGDVLLCISTSGCSPNLVAAVETASAIGVETWSLVGHDGAVLAQKSDAAIALSGKTRATTQELHLLALHGLCSALDHEFGQPHG